MMNFYFKFSKYAVKYREYENEQLYAGYPDLII